MHDYSKFKTSILHMWHTFKAAGVIKSLHCKCIKD